MSLNASAKSIVGLFVDFIAGYRLIDGGDLAALVNLEFGTKDGLVALAGGGAGGTPLPAAINGVTTVAADNDSVVLGFAIPGASQYVVNNGSHTLAVFPNQANPQNGNVADQISPHSAVAPGASTTIATGYAAQFVCFKLGVWKTLVSA